MMGAARPVRNAVPRSALDGLKNQALSRDSGTIPPVAASFEPMIAGPPELTPCSVDNCAAPATIIHGEKPYCGKHAFALLQAEHKPGTAFRRKATAQA